MSTVDNERERRALVEVVASLEHAQQHELVEEFVALFHPDAVWVTGGGLRLIGREAIAEFTRQVLPGAMAHSTARYDVEHIVFVRPDVAVVAVRQRPIDLDGVAAARPAPAQCWWWPMPCCAMGPISAEPCFR